MTLNGGRYPLTPTLSPSGRGRPRGEVCAHSPAPRLFGPLAILIASAVVLCAGAGGSAAEDADFYAGKTLTIIAGFPPGGGVDGEMRILAKYFSKYIPGHPVIVAKNMQGAGGIILANHLYNIAPADGLTLGMPGRSGFLLSNVVPQKGVNFDLDKFSYVGAAGSAVNALWLSRNTGIRTLAELKASKKEIVIGALNVRSENAVAPKVLAAYEHWPLKVVRVLPVPGADLLGVVYVRTLADAIALKPLIAAAENVVVIGGGFIGLECAAVAATLGCKVVVLEAMERLMGRVVSPVLSAYYRELHRSHGVDVRLGVAVTEIVGEGGRATGVRCGDATIVPADLIVVGIGVIPNAELAAAAGLPCDRGIIVDGELRTADPRIYAIGDCAAFPHPMAQGLIRLESVQNAVDQGKAVAQAILGEAKPYAAVPWFWSDQYDVKLQIVGLTQNYDDTVTLGNVGEGRFSVLYFGSGRLIGIDSVNRPSDHVVGRKLFAAGKTITPEAARAPGFDLRSSL